MPINYIAINCFYPPSGAILSPCGLYRYALWRWTIIGQGKGIMLFIMLNPSTADANINDATIVRCMGYAAHWGYGTLLVANLFALRATDPSHLRGAHDPVGPLNDLYLASAIKQAHGIVCAWGTLGGYMGRDEDVISLIARHGKKGYALGFSLAGYPIHPLYQKADAALVDMSGSNTLQKI